MKFIYKMLLTALVVLLLSNILPGIYVNNYITAIIVALVLGFLNTFIKPLLIFFTLPITVITLGLFLLVINTFIIICASHMINGFRVSGFWYAMLFSLLLSFFQPMVSSFIKENKQID